MFVSKAKELLRIISSIEADKEHWEKKRIPENCYFVDKDTIVCGERQTGYSHYPYTYDGATMWVNTTGRISVSESMFYVMGKDPTPCFEMFIGEKRGEKYFPVSMTCESRQAVENNVKRYTVFQPSAAYYIVKTDTFSSVLRLFIDNKKILRFSVCLINDTDKDIDTYIATYCNPILLTVYSGQSALYRKGVKTENGFLFDVIEYMDRNTCWYHYGSFVRSAVDGGDNVTFSSTLSREEFFGGTSYQLSSSQALVNGYFPQEKKVVAVSDVAVAGDIIRLSLKGGESCSVSYSLAYSDEKSSIENYPPKIFSNEYIDNALVGDKKGDDILYKNIPEISFEGVKDIETKTFELFINSVFRQVEYCSRAKNYAGYFTGVRDIFQQLEGALMWIAPYCRKKMIEALGYIGENGRPPRQYSYPQTKGAIPRMDMRPYIDQGVWIIETIYEYLAFSDDYSILNEECGYYKFIGDSVSISHKRDSVLEHVIAIVDYLLSNIDDETGCLKILYGDWNDAVDGLGKKENEPDAYGNGVSVMATLQLWRNLNSMQEILGKVGGYDDLIKKYTQCAESIKKGLLNYAVVSDGDSNRKILHGWGDKRKFLVGSFLDSDGESRDGLTANAYWVLSEAINWDKSLKKDILSAYDRLDSKYGMKTFEPYFSERNKDVGRIILLPKGAAENGATYIHATLFGVWSLFKMGEAKKAWEQIYKVLPICHEKVSLSPFVMPNSYIYDPESGYDGESLGDWFTGSGTVLIKTLVRCAFGIEPDLDGITIAPANYLPFDAFTISLPIKDTCLNIVYTNTGKGKRTFTVNGKEVEGSYDEDRLTSKIYLNSPYEKRYDIVIND